MRTRTLLIPVLLLIASARAEGADPPIRLWFSTSPTTSNGPESPTVALAAGNRATLYLWGRPSARASLQNFSLNVVSSAAGVDLADGTYTVFNAATSTKNRFEFVSDSMATPPLTSELTEAQSFANADSLLNLQGFTVFSSLPIGVGPNCSGGALQCHVTPDGNTSWLLGSITIKGLTLGTVAQLRLQVGDAGMNQEIFSPGDYDASGLVDVEDYNVWKRNFGSTLNLDADGNGDRKVDAADYTLWRDRLGSISTIENSSATMAMFGSDNTPASPQPVYNTLTHRGVSLVGDDPDATITVTGPAAGMGGMALPEPTTAVLAGWLLLAGIRARYGRPRRESATVR